MAVIPHLPAVSLFWSTSTFTKIARSPSSCARALKSGPICLHGPHQVAVKSTTTSLSSDLMSWSKTAEDVTWKEPMVLLRGMTQKFAGLMFLLEPSSISTWFLSSTVFDAIIPMAPLNYSLDNPLSTTWSPMNSCWGELSITDRFTGFIFLTELSSKWTCYLSSVSLEVIVPFKPLNWAFDKALSSTLEPIGIAVPSIYISNCVLL